MVTTIKKSQTTQLLPYLYTRCFLNCQQVCTRHLWSSRYPKVPSLSQLSRWKNPQIDDLGEFFHPPFGWLCSQGAPTAAGLGATPGASNARHHSHHHTSRFPSADFKLEGFKVVWVCSSYCWHFKYHWRTDFTFGYTLWPNSVMFLDWFQQQKAKRASNILPKHDFLSFKRKPKVFKVFQLCLEALIFLPSKIILKGISNPIIFLSILPIHLKNSINGLIHQILELQCSQHWGIPRSTCWGACAKCCCCWLCSPTPPPLMVPLHIPGTVIDQERSHGQILRKFNKLENNLWKRVWCYLFCWFAFDR